MYPRSIVGPYRRLIPYLLTDTQYWSQHVGRIIVRGRGAASGARRAVPLPRLRVFVGFLQIAAKPFISRPALAGVPRRCGGIYAMVAANQAELVEILITGEVERLLGTPESIWLDFKRDPYELGTAKGKWECLKDVVALANEK
jgi:hypothetical protein